MDDTVNAFTDMFTLQGEAAGPLHGVSFAVKDIFDVAGHVAGCGNPEWKRTHPVADKHAPVISKLLDAGARFFGKTHTDELAYSLMGVNTHYGTPLNTADPRRVPGGSSSGSAAAVAAGLVGIGLGSDTGGSVRLPASFCGIWGIRTTFGQIALDGTMPFTHSFDTVGWFARSAAMMDRVAQSLHCPDGPLPTQLLLPVDVWARAGADAIAAVAPRLAQLEALMGPATPILLSEQGLEDWRETFRICQAFEVWDVHKNWVSSQTPNFGAGIRERFQAASQIDRATFQAADAKRVAVQSRIREIVTPDVVLVLPTGPGPAPFRATPENDLNGFRTRALEMLCIAGLSGLPQLSMPAGFVDDGPVGLSLVGAKDQDRQLISIGMALEDGQKS